MSDNTFSASKALLGAGIAGLLCVASAACSVGSADGDTPVPDTACVDGVSPDPAVTSTTVGPTSQPAFEAMCRARGGIFEVQPHCGGSNACRGFSYDAGTQQLTEHTCRATNTCSGYSCVVC